MIRSDTAESGTEVVDLGVGSFGILTITTDLAGVEFGLAPPSWWSEPPTGRVCVWHWSLRGQP